jgi:hypothetical protein
VTTWPDVFMEMVKGPIGMGLAAALTSFAVSRGLVHGNKRARATLGETASETVALQLRERDTRLAALERKLGWTVREAFTPEHSTDDTKP